MRKLLYFAVLLIVLVVCASSSQAALYDRGGGLIYDDVLNVTWLQNANYSGISGIDWYDAMSWAENLIYQGYSDWRLPQLLPVNGISYDTAFSFDGSTDFGYNIISPNSELAYMFYVNLGNDAKYDTSGNAQSGGLSNSGPFTNLQPYFYWSMTNDPDFPAVSAMGFFNGDGSQYATLKTYTELQGGPFFAWALRDGDSSSLPPPSVPEPAILLLFSIGLAGIGFMRRKLRS